jgi:hypothetical protein
MGKRLVSPKFLLLTLPPIDVPPDPPLSGRTNQDQHGKDGEGSRLQDCLPKLCQLSLPAGSTLLRLIARTPQGLAQGRAD